jgi:hypothetical protein
MSTYFFTFEGDNILDAMNSTPNHYTTLHDAMRSYSDKFNLDRWTLWIKEGETIAEVSNFFHINPQGSLSK